MEDDELDLEYDNEQLADVSAVKPTADAPRVKTRSTKGSGG
jgi:hypothetical protein